MEHVEKVDLVETVYAYLKRVKNEIKREQGDKRKKRGKTIELPHGVEINEAEIEDRVKEVFNLLPKQTRMVTYSVVGYDDSPVYGEVKLMLEKWPEFVYSLDSFEESLKKFNKELAREVCQQVYTKLDLLSDLVLPYCWYDNNGGRCEVIFEKVEEGKIEMVTRINWFSEEVEENRALF